MTRAANGQRKAQDLERRLTQAEFRKRAQLTERQMQMLEQIADGRPPRNAHAIIRAIEKKVDHAYEKPRQGIDLTVKTHSELVAEAAKLAEGDLGGEG